MHLQTLHFPAVHKLSGKRQNGIRSLFLPKQLRSLTGIQLFPPKLFSRGSFPRYGTLPHGSFRMAYSSSGLGLGFRVKV